MCIRDRHYSCESEETVFELYPRTNIDAQDNTRLGFKVLDINTLISDFKIETTYDFNGKNIYVVKDPDGRKVEIS